MSAWLDSLTGALLIFGPLFPTWCALGPRAGFMFYGQFQTQRPGRNLHFLWAEAIVREICHQVAIESLSMQNAPHTFHEMLITTRVEAGHSIDTLAVLLNLPPGEYERIEQGKYPDDEVLTRLCKLMGWNYHDAQRLIINEMISPHPRTAEAEQRAAPAASSAPGTPQSFPSPGVVAAAAEYESLSQRLREARANVGQSPDILALLLKVSVEEYKAIEAGQSPSDEVLRRISLVFNWNYLDLLEMVRADQASVFQPAMPGRPFPESTAKLHELRQLTDELQVAFPRLPLEDQRLMLSQLKLVRDTMRRYQVRDNDSVTRRA